MKKDLVDLTPRELDLLLLSDYGVSLIELAEFLHDVIKFVGVPFKDPPPLLVARRDAPTWEIKNIARENQRTELEFKDKMTIVQRNRFSDPAVIRGLKKRLINLKKRVVLTTIEADRYLGNREAAENYKTNKKEEFEKWFTAEYELEPFFKWINDIIWEIDYWLKSTPVGAPVNKKSLLACMWALLIIEHKKRINWPRLVDIIDWFGQFLSPYNAYKNLFAIDQELDPEYLKNQLFKHKKRWETYFRHCKADLWDAPDGLVIVFGKKETDKILKVWLSSDTHKDPYHILAADLLKRHPNSKGIIIFPDFSYHLA